MKPRLEDSQGSEASRLEIQTSNFCTQITTVMLKYFLLPSPLQKV
jgi:hypothetical protein